MSTFGRICVFLLCVGISSKGVGAQLISPGELAQPHAELDGIRRCTQCHQLGTRGVSAERCLDCHTPLAERIEAETGYHASVPSDDCAQCHQDHLGRDFDLVRMDVARFAHSETGYDLEGAHTEVDCRSCHQPEWISDPVVRAVKQEHQALDRTFLGLDQECASCHQSVDPHDGAFSPRSCADCHAPQSWNEVGDFDHDQTGFALTGLHQSATCADCHGSPKESTRASGVGGGLSLPTTCAGCHDSPHGNTMSSTCADCHSTSGWHSLRAGSLEGEFDHGRTGFELRGAHVSASCAACHRPGRPPRDDALYMTYLRGTASNSYPLPEASSCASCHIDRHAFPGRAGQWTGCPSCHIEAGWTPSSYGLAEHTASASFPLTGAHAATPCFACHQDPDAAGTFVIGLGTPSCSTCHESDERHRTAYAELTCESCHTTGDFRDVDFAHDGVADGSCAQCHDIDDPHGGQFEASPCAGCHGTESFAIPDFDHAATAFPLDGAHESTDCRSCHIPRTTDVGTVIQYRPLGADCVDCHGESP